jgi:hypothetical protein
MKFTGCCLVGILLGSVAPRTAGAVPVQGTLLYEKVPATANGLDLAHPVQAPAAGIDVAMVTPGGGKVIARSVTDENGAYQFEVPKGTGPLSVYVWARSGNIEVQDPATNGVYGVIRPAVEPADWPEDNVTLLQDRGRESGPFNILAMLRKANRLLEQIEPGLPLAGRPLVVYWSPAWNSGTVVTESALYFNGRRDIDSDEFDDSVVLNSYGEYLLRRFTPVSGPKGPTYLGERVDPRQAWVDGWSNFFAQAVLGTPVFIDTQILDEGRAITFDLDQDQFDGDAPGYWSAADVATALWDLSAPAGREGPHLGLGLGPIWQVMREYFPRQVFPYLITLADGLIQQDRSREAAITAILARRQIEYQFGKEPPVPAPFPRRIASGVAVTGQVDSLTSHRTNVLEATDYYLVQKGSTGPLRVQFTLTGESSPGDGRLELELVTAAGDGIKGTGLSLWGAGDRSELTVPLPPGRYVIAVKSYVFRTGLASGTFFSKATYALTADF